MLKNKTALICLAMTMLFSLTGCVDSNVQMTGSTSVLTANDATFMKLASMVITPESEIEYQLALEEQERRSHYIDVEPLYHEAYLKYYNDFSEAYNIGIIDEKGIPTGTVNTSFDSYSVEMLDKDAFMAEANKNVDRESLLTWLQTQKFITEGPEMVGEEAGVYLDVMLSEFSISPGVTIGFTKEQLDVATREDILNWLSDFYNVEKNNVEYYRERVAKMTAEELALRVSQLLGQDFTNPQVDKRISVVNNRHILTENTIKTLGPCPTLDLSIYNSVYTIDLTSLGRKPVYGETYSCELSEDGTKMILKLFIDGQEEVFNLPIDEATNQVVLSKYEVYRLLGMKVYV